ncbi:Tom37 C-terminal domain-containing protein [Gigaspora margarita]|uniref:Tom37 C-terminal domain-containing protein n=1 Tax=Gigaspora margarita TaxID=4874 RepID=A0A8H3XBG6_GIGMA|nr:Tom37 C-terminal domain-containing protein [Gigaspora margarita]
MHLVQTTNFTVAVSRAEPSQPLADHAYDDLHSVRSEATHIIVICYIDYLYPIVYASRKMLYLYVWGSHWGLPSIDPACLSVISYLQLVSDEWKVVECSNPNVSPTGELPVLRDGLNWITGAHNIISHLKKNGLNVDENLNDKQKADSLAFSAYIEECVYDILLFAWYVDSKNFIEVIRPLYVRLLSFPMQYFLPTQLRNSAKERLERHGIESIGDTGFIIDKDKKMNKIVYESYNVLQKKLGTNEFFFGNQPSSLDAFVYGYLALHIYTELPNSELSTILNTEYPRLSRFCERMKDRLSSRPISHLPATDLPSFFSGLCSSPRTWFSRNIWRNNIEEVKKEKSEAQIKFERTRNLSIFGAICFVVAFVAWNGIISIEFDEEDDEKYTNSEGKEIAEEIDEEIEEVDYEDNEI